MIDLGFLPLQSHRPSVEGLLTWAMQTGAVVSVLIVGVLLIRRPFAKIFGAQAAYALWALPLLRLFVPSVAVPERWLFWRETAVTAASTDTLDPAFLLPLEGIAAPVPSFNWAAFFVASWIIGAVLWLLWQGGVYRRARRDLMKGSYDASARIATVSKDCAKILDLKSTPEILISNANHGPQLYYFARSTGLTRSCITPTAAFARTKKRRATPAS